jgi:hypothetical protein
MLLKLVEDLYSAFLKSWLKPEENRLIWIATGPILGTVILLCLAWQWHPGFDSSFKSQLARWIFHWLFFLLLGLSFIGFGTILLLRGTPTEKFRRLAGMVPIVFGATLCFAGLMLRPSQNYEQGIVIAVARFTPVGQLAEADAVAIPRRIRDQLTMRTAEFQKQSDSEPHIKIIFLKDARIEGYNEEQMKKAALDIGNDVHADLIIWGEVCKEESFIKATARITVIRELAGTRLEIKPINVPVCYHPPHMKFKQMLAHKSSDLTTFVVALLSHYMGRVDDAINLLAPLEDDQARYLHALALMERSKTAQSPRKDLLAAERRCNSLVLPASERLTILDDKIVLWALFSRSNALLSLALTSHPENCISQLRDALSGYEEVFRAVSRERDPHFWAAIQANSGMTLLELAVRSPLDERTSLLEESRVRLLAAKAVFDWESLGQAITASVNLGIVYRYLAQEATDDKRHAYLTDAIHYFDAAFRDSSRARILTIRSLILSNKGAALTAIAPEVWGEDRRRLLTEGMETLRAASTLLSRPENPYLWAMTHQLLAGALNSLAEFQCDSEAAQLSKQALDSCNLALTIFTIDAYPQQWAQTLEVQGAILRDSALRARGEPRQRLFAESIAAYRSMLTVYSRNNSDNRYAGIQKEIGMTLTASGMCEHSERAVSFLREALLAYDSVLQMKSPQVACSRWVSMYNGKGLTLLALADHQKNDERIRLVREALGYFYIGLMHCSAELYPCEWAEAQINIGRAFLAYANIRQAHGEKELFSKALEAVAKPPK